MSATPVEKKVAIEIHSTAVVANKASLSGTHGIEIGENTVIHPYAKLRADHGKIIIGAHCTVSEGAVIGIVEGEGNDVVLEDYVQVESGAIVRASRVGECSRLGIHSVVEQGSAVGKGCTIPPKTILEAGERLNDYSTLLHGSKLQPGRTLATQDAHMETRRQQQVVEVITLRKLLPNAAAKYTSS